MSDYGIKPEWREAWKFAGRHKRYVAPVVDDLADFSVHLLAELKRERFEHEHDTDWHPCWDGQPCDPRHKYEYADWCADARKELGR